eukprot:PhF_6_TR23798/c0_g1_i1/m.33309
MSIRVHDQSFFPNQQQINEMILQAQSTSPPGSLTIPPSTTPITPTTNFRIPIIAKQANTSPQNVLLLIVVKYGGVCTVGELREANVRNYAVNATRNRMTEETSSHAVIRRKITTSQSVHPRIILGGVIAPMVRDGWLRVFIINEVNNVGLVCVTQKAIDCLSTYEASSQVNTRVIVRSVIGARMLWRKTGEVLLLNTRPLDSAWPWWVEAQAVHASKGSLLLGTQGLELGQRSETNEFAKELTPVTVTAEDFLRALGDLDDMFRKARDLDHP